MDKTNPWKGNPHKNPTSRKHRRDAMSLKPVRKTRFKEAGNI